MVLSEGLEIALKVIIWTILIKVTAIFPAISIDNDDIKRTIAIIRTIILSQ